MSYWWFPLFFPLLGQWTRLAQAIILYILYISLNNEHIFYSCSSLVNKKMWLQHFDKLCYSMQSIGPKIHQWPFLMACLIMNILTDETEIYIENVVCCACPWRLFYSCICCILHSINKLNLKKNNNSKDSVVIYSMRHQTLFQMQKQRTGSLQKQNGSFKADTKQKSCRQTTNIK